MPTHAEYADATLKAARAALTETGDGATSFTLQHVPAALLSLANAAGIDSSKVSPFLADIGIGLTATGKTAEQVCSSRPGTKQSLLGSFKQTFRACPQLQLYLIANLRCRPTCIVFTPSVSQVAHLSLQPCASGVAISPVVLDKSRHRKLSANQLRQLCIDFLITVA